MTEKTVDTLVSDIEDVLVNGISEDVDDGIIDRFASSLALLLKERLIREEREKALRMSNIGKPCTRQLWYEINSPEDGEELRAETYMKFLYGDVIEELLIFLAELAGHKVEGRQDEQEIAGIKGHRDAVINGMIVDVKSASPYSFKKFKEHKLADDDAFGYIDQIQSYIHAGQDDPVVTVKDEGAFLVLDKVGGHICLDKHKKEDFDIEAVYEYKKSVVAADEPPARGFDPEPDGYVHKEKGFVPNGNEKLGLNCSYCAFKHKCHPGLRTFLSYKGPVFFTKVVKEPKMPEIVNDTDIKEA